MSFSLNFGQRCRYHKPILPVKKAPPQKKYLSQSCAEVAAAFGLLSEATELQKKEAWKKFNNQWVRWTGQVASVSETFGTLQLQVKCLKSTFTSDAIISFDDKWKSRLLALRKGDPVTFEAKLGRTGTILGLSLSEGKIISP